MIFLSAYEITGTANFSQIMSAITNLQSSLNNIRAPKITPEINMSGGGLQQALGGLKGEMMSDAGNFAKIGQTVGQNFTTGMTAQFGMLGNVAGSVASALGPVGIAAGIAGAAVIALGAASVSTASNWQSLMANVAKTTGLEGTGLTTLSDELTEISTKAPIAADELAKIAAVAGSLGVGDKLAGPEKAKAIAGFSEMASQMAVAFELPAEEAATSSAKILTAFNQPINTKNMEALGNVVNTMGDNYAATESQVLDFTNRASYLNTTFGMSIPQVAAWGTALISAGMESETASTGIKSLMNMSMDPKKFDAFAKAAGMSSEELRDSLNKDVVGTYAKVADNIAGSTDAVEKFQTVSKIAGTEGMSALLKMAGKQDILTEATAAANEQQRIAMEGEGGGSMGKTFEAQSATLSSQMVMLKNSISAVFKDIGTPLLAPLSSGVALLTSGLNAARAAGEALVGVIGNSRAFESLKNIGSTIASSISGMIAPLSSAISTIFSSIGGTDTLQKVFDGMTAPLTLALDIINEILSVAGSISSSGFSQLDTTIKAIVSSLETAKAYLQAFGEVTGLSAAFDKAKSAIDGIISKVKEIGSNVYNGVSEALPKVADALAKIAGDFGAAVAKYLTDKISEVANALGLGGAVKKLGAINDRAQEILAGKAAGDAMAEGIKESDALAKAPGEALGSDAAMDGIKDAGKTAGDDWVKSFGSAAEAGMTLVGYNIKTKTGGVWASENEIKRDTAPFEYMGKQWEMGYKNNRPSSLYLDGVQVGTVYDDMSPAEAFQAITRLPAPEEGTAAYFGMMQDSANAKLAELAESMMSTDLFHDFGQNMKTEMAGIGKEIWDAFASGMTPDTDKIQAAINNLKNLKIYDPEAAKKQGTDNAIAYLTAMRDAVDRNESIKAKLLAEPDNENLIKEFKESTAQVEQMYKNSPVQVKAVIPFDEAILGHKVQDAADSVDWDTFMKTGNAAGIKDLDAFIENEFHPNMQKLASTLLENGLYMEDNYIQALDLVEAYTNLSHVQEKAFTPEQLNALEKFDGSYKSLIETLKVLAKETKSLAGAQESYAGEFDGLFYGQFRDPSKTWRDYINEEGGYAGPTEDWVAMRMEEEIRNQQITASLKELEAMKHPLEFEATINTDPAIDDITALEQQIVGTEASITITADTTIAEDRWMNLVNVIQTTPVVVPLTVAVNAYEVQSMVRAAIADAIASA